MKRLEIEIEGKKYPFYRTMRSRVMFDNSNFSVSDLTDGKIEAVLFVAYSITLGACLRERIEFKMDFDEFVNQCPDNAVDLIASLDTENTSDEEQGKKKQEKKKQ